VNGWSREVEDYRGSVAWAFRSVRVNAVFRRLLPLNSGLKRRPDGKRLG